KGVVGDETCVWRSSPERSRPVNPSPLSPKPMSPESTSAWRRLRTHREHLSDVSIAELFAADPDRGPAMTVEHDGIVLDYSKNLLTARTVELLAEFAAERDLDSGLTALFAGDRINTSENRPALHTALRAPADDEIIVDGSDVVPAVHDVLARMGEFATRVRDGAWRGATGDAIRTVVNMGIGGSDLGPAMAYQALRHAAELDVRFVANVDGHDLAGVLRSLDPATTL